MDQSSSTEQKPKSEQDTTSYNNQILDTALLISSLTDFKVTLPTEQSSSFEEPRKTGFGDCMPHRYGMLIIRNVASDSRNGLGDEEGELHIHAPHVILSGPCSE